MMTNEDQINKKIQLLLVGLGALGVAGGITYFTGNQGPHNVELHGHIADEKEVYGNIITGYSTERSGIGGWVEKKAHDVIRPGVPSHLYRLQVDGIEYDTKEWFRTVHHFDEVGSLREIIDDAPIDSNLEQGLDELEILNGLYVQTEGDMNADIGDKFSTPIAQLGRISNTLALRGVRYELETDEGVKTIDLRFIYLNPQLKIKTIEQ